MRCAGRTMADEVFMIRVRVKKIREEGEEEHLYLRRKRCFVLNLCRYLYRINGLWAPCTTVYFSIDVFWRSLEESWVASSLAGRLSQIETLAILALVGESCICAVDWQRSPLRESIDLLGNCIAFRKTCSIRQAAVRFTLRTIPRTC